MELLKRSYWATITFNVPTQMPFNATQLHLIGSVGTYMCVYNFQKYKFETICDREAKGLPWFLSPPHSSTHSAQLTSTGWLLFSISLYAEEERVCIVFHLIKKDTKAWKVG